jgi:hypothetical protein
VKGNNKQQKQSRHMARFTEHRTNLPAINAAMADAAVGARPTKRRKVTRDRETDAGLPLPATSTSTSTTATTTNTTTTSTTTPTAATTTAGTAPRIDTVIPKLEPTDLFSLQHSLVMDDAVFAQESSDETEYEEDESDG